jgi:predicted dehydrogenase
MEESMNKYTVAIIGCGSIGALKGDYYDSPTTDAILTHAHAFHNHPDTESLFFVDSIFEKAKLASTKWDAVPITYTGWAERKIYADIVVVATPTHTHRDVLMEALTHQPRLVIAEKPFCSNLKDAQEVHDAYAKAGIPILVDYIRRFDPVGGDFFERIRDGHYGEVYHARCFYGRGLRRDGCHAIDLFNMMFGDVNGVLSYDRSIIYDGEPDDPTQTIHFNYDRCGDVNMVGIDSINYGLFEMDFATEKGILRFIDWGKTILHYSVKEEVVFGQYKALSEHPGYWYTGLTKALLYLADNAVKYLRSGEPLLCTSKDAIRVHQVLGMIK